MRATDIGAVLLLALVTAGAPTAAAADELTPVRPFRTLDRSSFPELPESLVVDLLQDDRGVLWISTTGGLATWDGTAMSAVQDPEAPRGVAFLALRRSGGVYAGSRRGVHVFDGRWRFVSAPGEVSALADDESGRLWALVRGAVWTTELATRLPKWTPSEMPASLGRPLGLLGVPAGGVVVLGTRGFAACTRGAWRAIAGGAAPPPEANVALVTRAGTVWVGTSDGRVIGADALGWHSQAVDAGPGGVRSMAEDRAGRVWAGGTGRLCSGTLEAAWSCWGPTNGVPEQAILSLLGDREGSVWLGTNGAGLRQLSGTAWTHLTRWPGTAPSAGLDVIGLAREADGAVLASVFGRGILRFDGRAFQAWDRRDGLEEDVRAIAAPERGLVWAAARHGVWERGRDGRFRRTLTLAQGFASGFARDPAGRWLVWTDDYGVFRRSGAGVWERAEDVNAAAGRAPVRALLAASDGALWIGTARALYVLRAGGAVERMPTGAENAMPETVSALVERAPGEVWVGGQEGLAIVAGAQRRRVEGAPGNVYFLRAAPDGSVYAGGSRGVTRFRGGAFTRFDHTSGLLADECNGGAVVLPDGSLLAGTAGSLARLDASARLEPPAPLRLFWQERASEEPQRLALGRRALTVAWSAPWLGAGPLEYATRVGDGPWSPPTRGRELRIESLAPGLLEIAVRARRGGEPWTEPLVRHVEVPALFHETLAARAAAAAALGLLLLLAGHAVAQRRQARREHALVRMRDDFIAAASHDLRTPIAQIRLFADVLRLRRARDAAERQDAVETIHRATLRLESLTGNLLQIAKGPVPPSARTRTDVARLLQGVADEFAGVAAAAGSTLEVAPPGDLHADLDVDGMRRALCNVVDNALKYGPPGQVVRLGAASVGGELRLFVEDQGPGIPTAERERVWERFVRLDRDRESAVAGTGLGLAVVRDTVARTGGRAWLEDVEPTGLRVEVRVPQGRGRPS